MVGLERIIVPKEVNLIGQTFGRLTVIEKHTERSKNGKALWIVKCSCGNSEPFKINSGTMKSGNTTSCGCLRREATRNKFRKHGMHGSPEYWTWVDISRRCYTKTFKQYKDYGGRGIKMSDEWRDSFEAFYRDMGPKPSPQHSIDRKDNDGDYCKENCRWTTKGVQANNTRANVYYEINGEKLTIAQMADKFDMPYSTMRTRLIYLPVEAAIDRNVKFEDFVYEIEGMTKTMKEWLLWSDISFEEYVVRRRDGWTITEALCPVKKNLVEIDGISNTVEFWLGLYGITNLLEITKICNKLLNGHSFIDIVKEHTK